MKKIEKSKKVHGILGIIILTGIVFLMGSCNGGNIDTSQRGYWPEGGVVPNESVAISIAEAVWLPIYGDSIYSKQPFVAIYNESEGCWNVRGSLPPNMMGGVPEISINKSDGKVLFIYHGK